MASPYDDNPEATNFRCKVSKLRSYTMTAVGFAQSFAAGGGDPQDVYDNMATEAAALQTEVNDLEITGIPSELIDYRQAWLDKSATYWPFG